MDGQAIVENYQEISKDKGFTVLNIDRLQLHLAKYLIRLLFPVMEFKPSSSPTGRLGILRKNQRVSEYITIDEYRHYMAFTLIPEIEEIAKKYNYPPIKTPPPLSRARLLFAEVKPILEDLFPEMDLTEDPRKTPGESWETFIRAKRPNFSLLLRVLYDVSYDIPEDAILSYLRGIDHDNWELTSNSD
jgi:hypothetical protein